jgi:hypothetical protein
MMIVSGPQYQSYLRGSLSTRRAVRVATPNALCGCLEDSAAQPGNDHGLVLARHPLPQRHLACLDVERRIIREGRANRSVHDGIIAQMKPDRRT